MARKCILCGNKYEYCPSCPKDAKKETWYAIYDSENCKNISKTLTDYNLNQITKSEAKTRLSDCDLTIELNDHYRGEINDIMAFEEISTEEITKPKRNARYKTKIVEEAIPEEIKEEILDEVVVE